MCAECCAKNSNGKMNIDIGNKYVQEELSPPLLSPDTCSNTHVLRGVLQLTQHRKHTDESSIHPKT